MKTVVTGAAGFIGSRLSAALLRAGHSVIGIDSFTDYYEPALKRTNIEPLIQQQGFALVEADLAVAELDPLFADTDVVFHLAGQPGVRGSWANGFGVYVERNVTATQRVLEAARRCATSRVVYASSSSVYGDGGTFPSHEDSMPRPFSPYGVTKLAGELLACLYATNFGLSTVSLRYFTVFGPGQRPEMAMAQVIDAALTGVPFKLFSAGQSLRDFTFVDDIVSATLAAGLLSDVPAGLGVNVAGGSPATMNDVISTVGELIGRRVPCEVVSSVPGDVARTGGDHSKARETLGWAPAVSLREGLRRQIEWRAAGLSSPTFRDPRQSVTSIRRPRVGHSTLEPASVAI